MTEEERKQAIDRWYRDHGINPDLFIEFGDANIMLQCFSNANPHNEEDMSKYHIHPGYFMPRKETMWTDPDGVDLSNTEARVEYVAGLKDSIERTKIFTLLLEKHLAEIELYGYPVTSVYYPEITEQDLASLEEIEKSRGKLKNKN